MSAVPPTADDAPVFAEPWQARAFAVVVKLCQDGHTEWDEFQQRLIDEIEHWLAACERLLVERGLAAPGDLARRKAEAAASRPPPTKAVANPVAVDPARR